MESMERQHVKLYRKHKINGPPTGYYVPEFITEEEEKNITSNIYNVPKPKWTQLSNRRLQNWGGIPHNKGMIAEKIPNWLDTCLNKIHNLDLMGGKKPNHVLVNEYIAGQGILPHLDGSLFYPTITTISLGSHTVLQFYEPLTEEKLHLEPSFSILLEPRSLLVLQDDLYKHYLHGIKEKSEDIIDSSLCNLDKLSYNIGDTLHRQTRISLTIRHVPKTTAFKLNFNR